MRNLRSVLLGLALLAARPAMAGVELAGTTGANFLTIGPSASVMGMGGAGNAGYPDLSSMTWNPAALGLLNDSQLMLTHMPLPNSASQEWMSFGGRMGVVPTRWALSGRYEGDGSFQAKDPLGNVTGTFNSSSLALAVNAARPLDLHTVVGMGAKFVNENLGAVSGYGGTFDIGVVYHTGPLTFGATALNMGGSMKYDSLAYSMPLTFGTGLALSSVKTGLTVAVDYNHPNAYYNDVRTGIEWMWKDRFALRAGYRKELNAPTNDPLTGVSGGLGFGGHGLWLDYAYVSSADGGNQQRVSIRVSPKEWAFLANDVDNSGGTGGGVASTTPAPARPAPAASSTPAPATASTSASSIAPVPSSPAPAAAPPVMSPSPPSAASSSASASVAPSVAPSAAPAPISPKPSAPAPPPVPAPVAVMPPPVAPAPSVPMPSAPSSKPSAPEPSAPTPELTTLVPVTPPAVPAPKPVVTSKPNALPGVSAPAPQGQPTEAPVTTPANGQGKQGKPASASAAKPAVAATPAIESAVDKDGKPVRIHVKKDETLESIAKRFGTTKAAIMMENDLVTEKIRPGQELKIPNHQ